MKQLREKDDDNEDTNIGQEVSGFSRSPSSGRPLREVVSKNAEIIGGVDFCSVVHRMRAVPKENKTRGYKKVLATFRRKKADRDHLIRDIAKRRNQL